MSIKEFAEKISGLEYPARELSEFHYEAKNSGYLIAYGMSDDLLELRGVIDDELGACDGLITKVGTKNVRLEAVWCPESKPGSSWEIVIDCPHEVFTIMEEGEVFCFGVVVDSKHLDFSASEEREAVDHANGVLTAEDEAWKEAEKAMNQCQSTIARLNTDDGREQVYRSAVALTNYCHGVASECGWWKATSDRDVPRLLMLCVSELAEAMEGDRKQLMDDHLPDRPMLEVELADAVIRIFDMAGGLNLDVAGAIADKMRYNTQRADHKLHNRENGGKRY